MRADFGGPPPCAVLTHGPYEHCYQDKAQGDYAEVQQGLAQKSADQSEHAKRDVESPRHAFLAEETQDQIAVKHHPHEEERHRGDILHHLHVKHGEYRE